MFCRTVEQPRRIEKQRPTFCRPLPVEALSLRLARGRGAQSESEVHDGEAFAFLWLVLTERQLARRAEIDEFVFAFEIRHDFLLLRLNEPASRRPSENVRSVRGI